MLPKRTTAPLGLSVGMVTHLQMAVRTTWVHKPGIHCLLLYSLRSLSDKETKHWNHDTTHIQANRRLLRILKPSLSHSSMTREVLSICRANCSHLLGEMVQSRMFPLCLYTAAWLLQEHRETARAALRNFTSWSVQGLKLYHLCPSCRLLLRL